MAIIDTIYFLFCILPSCTYRVLKASRISENKTIVKYNQQLRKVPWLFYLFSRFLIWFQNIDKTPKIPCIVKTFRYYYHWRIQGAPPAPPPPPPPPQQDQFLSFLHTFLPKSVRIGGWRPPTGRRPPQREILDPPLITLHCVFFPLFLFLLKYFSSPVFYCSDLPCMFVSEKSTLFSCRHLS